MKFSYNWIRTMVDGLDIPAQSLERLITMKTAECEGIETAGELLNGAVPARVEAVEEITGGRHVVKAIVDAGRYGRKIVVCGAPNCRAGITTVYVPLGSKTLAGVVSEGMLASAEELGISRDHNGIIELDCDNSLPPADSVIDIDNKSITHRPDLWGHHGMAREVAAITQRPLRDPVNLALLPAPGSPIQVAIEDFTLCPRYSALVFENVTVKPSPPWFQARLTAIGLNTKNNIVDLTNYLMAELAQPTHAFDRAKLNGDTIYARPARDGETIVALNKETYALKPANLVIADSAGPIAIAGVIGGDESAISETTTSIVLESANFNAASVRRTTVDLKLRTDASMRFEKAQDPHNTVRALARALELLPMLSPGIRLVGGLTDSHSGLNEPKPVDLNLDWLARKLGRVLDPAEVRRILESLQFKVAETSSETFSVSIPTWRATKDIAMPEDLVEEVGRMIGYDSIEPAPPLVPCAPSYDPPAREYLRGVRRLMSARGYSEVSNYSFISEEAANKFGLPIEEAVRVLNPIAAGQELMRTSLLPGLHSNIVENAKHFDEFRIFEIGHEIHKDGETKPIETPHLIAAFYSKTASETVLELKGTAQALAPNLQIQPTEPKVSEHPARCAELFMNGAVIGRLSELHPALLDTGRVSILDLNLAALQEQASERKGYKPVQRFPSSSFDLSVIADARELAATLESHIRKLAGDLTETVEYVREFQGDPLPEGRKSVTFRITASAPDRTLSSAETTEIYDRIIAGLTSQGYEFRG